MYELTSYKKNQHDWVEFGREPHDECKALGCTIFSVFTILNQNGKFGEKSGV